MNLLIEKTLFKESITYISPIFNDRRGSFQRLLCTDQLKNFNIKIKQINYSNNIKKGTIRGMHYQAYPKSEIRIVRCVKGSIYDVIIDMRKNSKKYLQWFGVKLSKTNQRSIIVPKGFAHGFQTLSDNCEIVYFHTATYDEKFQKTVNYADQRIKIKWPLKITSISNKDLNS